MTVRIILNKIKLGHRIQNSGDRIEQKLDVKIVNSQFMPQV